MRKRVSKRRWKARYELGKPVPMKAVVEHRLRLAGSRQVNANMDAVVRGGG